MIEIKNYKDLDELKRALYVLRLHGIIACGEYEGKTYDNYGMAKDSVGVEMSPKECKDFLLDRANKKALLEKEDLQIKKEALRNVPGWMYRASKLIDAKKLNQFEKFIMECLESEYHGQEIEDSLDVMEYSKREDVGQMDIYEYILTKKTPYMVIVKIVSEYFFSTFGNIMEQQHDIRMNIIK